MKNNTIRKKYILNGESLDSIVCDVVEYAKANKIDDVSANRYGFLIDDALFSWIQTGAEGKTVVLDLGRHLFKPIVSISMQGDKISGKSKANNFGYFQSSLITNEGCLPDYRYEDDTNYLTLHLSKEPEMMKQIITVIIAAIIIACVGNLFFSQEFILNLNNNLIAPVTDTFFKLLRCISGPMVFLSVVWGIAGVGDQKTFGLIGKRVMLYCFFVTFIGAVTGAALFPFIGQPFSGSESNTGQFSSLFNLILSIIPSNIIEPFSNGNTLQIIFLAISVGIAVIALRGKASKVVTAVEQVNNIINYLMYFIGKLVPFIVFLLALNIIWTNSYSVLSTTWKFALTMICAFIVIVMIAGLNVSLKFKIKLSDVLKKNFRTFIIALTTASSAAAFGENLASAKKKYGIDDDLAGFSIPLGMIVHNPIAACYNILIVIYFGNVYNVSSSLSWLLTAIIVSTVVAISSPPIPGGATMVYAMLFTQMGIPEEALAIALLMDIITDFVVTAFETFVLPISLVNIADNLDMLDREKLKNQHLK